MKKKIILSAVLGVLTVVDLLGCTPNKTKSTKAEVPQSTNIQSKAQEKPIKQLTKAEQKKAYLDELYRTNIEIGTHKNDIDKLEQEFDRVIRTPDLLNYHVEKIKELHNAFKNVQPYEEYKEQYKYYIQGVQYYLDIYAILQDCASKKIDIRNNEKILNEVRLINDKLIACMNRAWDKIPLSGQY